MVGNEAQHLWDNNTDEAAPDSLGAFAKARRTDLATGLRSTIKTDEKAQKKRTENVETQTKSAAVLLSDGLHNKGVSPLETAKVLAGRDVPLHAVGLGSDQAPPDLAVLDVEAPEKILKDDRVKGTITLKGKEPIYVM